MAAIGVERNGTRTMLAVRPTPTGEARRYRCEPVPRPVPAIGEVLVRVHAAGITTGDLAHERSTAHVGPSMIDRMPVRDVAGTVAGFGGGDGQGRFVVGEEVFGVVDRDGRTAAAEYVTIPATSLSARPRRISFAESAALPVAAVSAWNALVEVGNLRRGQTVLIRGGASNVGLYAIQIAALIGAGVVTTAPDGTADLLCQLGANEVLGDGGGGWPGADLVLDAPNVAALLQEHRRNDPPANPDRQLDRWFPSAAPRPRQRGFSARSPEPQLALIAGLVDAGELRPVIAQTYPLAAADAAHRRATTASEPGATVLVVR